MPELNIGYLEKILEWAGYAHDDYKEDIEEETDEELSLAYNHFNKLIKYLKENYKENLIQFTVLNRGK